MASEQAAQIGARLRARREELGLTRRQLSHQMAGLAGENDLYRWEKGLHKPGDDTIAAIAQALGRDYAWAIGAIPDEPTPDLSNALADSGAGGGADDRLARMEQQLTRIEGALADLAAEREAQLLEARELLARLRDATPLERATGATRSQAATGR